MGSANEKIRGKNATAGTDFSDNDLPALVTREMNVSVNTAVRHGHVEILDLLLAHRTSLGINVNSHVVYSHVVLNSNVNSDSDDGENNDAHSTLPLHDAILYGRRVCAEKLIEAGADANKRSSSVSVSLEIPSVGKWGPAPASFPLLVTLLFGKARHGEEFVEINDEDEQEALMKYLFAHGATLYGESTHELDPDSGAFLLRNPLNYAIVEQKPKLVKVLLQNGADVR